MTPGTNKGAHVYGYSGMGNHNLSVADVDGDGKDEIIYGAMVVDDTGKGLFTTGLRHGDSLHVGDLDPTRPGLEVFGPHENEGGEYDKWTPGAALYDARTGKILWATPDGQDVGGGVSGDVDPRYAGEELWGIPGGLYSCKGEVISDPRARWQRQLEFCHLVGRRSAARDAQRQSHLQVGLAERRGNQPADGRGVRRWPSHS